MSRPKVAVLKTSPETVLEDYSKLMHLAEYQTYLPKDKEIALKINISWHYYYPACSTPPWQLEGVIKTLLDDGYPKENLYACHNRTVVVSAKRGERNNKHLPVVQKYGLRNIHLYENEEWVRYEPKGQIRVLYDIFPDGIKIPKRFIGSSIIHLPTMKTHVFTTMTGAMKNAFGGLLNEKRHYTHSVIHETLVDLLTIQKEIHSGIFAVMDGTIAGDGPGPRCMVPHIKNYILASADQVAIDAVAAKMMGFEPMELKFIRLAHEAGLGCGDVKEIEIVGEDISEVNFHFQKDKNTLASRGQKLIYWGPLKPLEKLLLRSFLTPWSYVASVIFHDYLWHPFIGRRRTKKILQTEWGKLFKQY
ncbi:MAG: DUF362 domain-containing protein [Candidatus Aminicenantes bacterium]|nr:DUF362 domain-containing protein [Candidatus Aminicenantes bacterium]